MSTVNISTRLSELREKNNGAEPTHAELMALLNEVQTKTVVNATRINLGEVDVQISEKGAVSVYRMGRFPVTLYAEQWDKLNEHMPRIMDFVHANRAKLASKKAKAKANP